MPLSAVAVKGAKPGPRAYKLSDSGGLYLFVQPSGQRYWRLAYRWALKQRTMALGVYPDVGLTAHGFRPVRCSTNRETEHRTPANASLR
jgi:hypothetical protein